MDDLRDPKFYASWTEEDLQGHIKHLNEVLRLKQGVRSTPDKGSLREMLDPKGSNFMGSNMSLEELVLSERIKDIQNSFTFMPNAERRRRRAIIIDLCVELSSVREKSRFSSAIAEQAIDAVISGDWCELKSVAQHMTFSDEDEWSRMHYAQYWTKFVDLCMKAFDARPGAEEVAVAPKN